MLNHLVTWEKKKTAISGNHCFTNTPRQSKGNSRNFTPGAQATTESSRINHLCLDTAKDHNISVSSFYLLFDLYAIDIWIHWHQSISWSRDLYCGGRYRTQDILEYTDNILVLISFLITPIIGRALQSSRSSLWPFSLTVQRSSPHPMLPEILILSYFFSDWLTEDDRPFRSARAEEGKTDRSIRLSHRAETTRSPGACSWKTCW
jgi:hypothetical protein